MSDKLPAEVLQRLFSINLQILKSLIADLAGLQADKLGEVQIMVKGSNGDIDSVIACIDGHVVQFEAVPVNKEG